MWGNLTNLAEKAKSMASDIDKQLNEAVGMDADPNAAASTNGVSGNAAAAPGASHNNAAAALAAATPSSATKLQVTDDDDVWNDDFDFDDDNEDDHKEVEGDKKEDDSDEGETIAVAPQAVAPPTTPSSPAVTTTTPSKEDNPVSPAKQEEKNDTIPPAPSTETEAEPTIQADLSPTKEEADQTDAPTAQKSIAPPAVTPAASAEEAESDKIQPVSTTPKIPAEPPQPSTALQETPAEAGWDEGTDDIEFSETQHEEEDTAGEASKEPPTDTSSPSTPPRSESPPPPQEPDSPPDPGAALAKASQMMFGGFGVGGSKDANESHAEEASTPDAEQKDDTPQEEKKPQSSAGVGSMFSNLAHRAEGGVSSLLNAAAHLAVDDKDGTKPVHKAKSENDLDGGGDNEWDEPDDLDITEHDGVEKAVSAATSQDAAANDDNESPPVTITEPESSNKLEKAVDVQSAGLTTAITTKSVTPMHSKDNSVDDAVVESFVQVSSPGQHLERQENIEKEDRMNFESATGSAPVANIEDDPRFIQLQEALRQREHQLANKAEQMNELQSMMESQEQEYRQKLQDTKEEAKKRIQRAKERCEAAESKLRLNASAGSEDAAKQEQIISELRAEGEALAMKQMAMEQSVRAAKGETRELREHLQDETAAKEKALEKIKSLEAELKSTKESLNAARKGESLSGKLENDLMVARTDAETKANTILSLQQHIKELTSESKDLKDEIAKIQKSAAHEAQQEKTNMRREHTGLISDLEQKLRTTEREAGVREDALRHEVAELRKRWQDAVRRADALSVDIQSSTAPLLRQLESMERQNRARAANWAELESRLRSELEESVIQNESLTKDRSDFKAKYTRFERMVKERDDELAAAKKTMEEQTTKIAKLESELEKMAEEAEKRQQEYEKVERLASEGVAKVRSEMSQTVMDSEERYRGQIHKMETELKTEKEKRTQLEKQVEDLLDNAGMIVPGTQAPEAIRKEAKPKKLRQAEGQAEILAGALGLDDSDDETDDEDDFGLERTASGDSDGLAGKRDSTTSFAALDQLTSRLKTAQVELESLRKSLRESEKTRESLVEELGESRAAKEKLPLFEAKVRELTAEKQEMELEIMGLREDIAEVKEMYRAQLNVLLEEKVGQSGPEPDDAGTPANSNGQAALNPADDNVDGNAPQDPITVE